MPIPAKLKNYLDKNKINYEEIKHKTVYTVHDKAETMKKKLKEIAKTLALKADKKYILVVLPADARLDLAKLKNLLGVKKLEIIKETVLSKVFKIKPGTHVPFGTYHKIPVFVDKALLKSRVVIASAGSYTDSVKIKTKDLLRTGGELLNSFSKKIK